MCKANFSYERMYEIECLEEIHNIAYIAYEICIYRMQYED